MIIRRSNRKTLALEITADGRLIVRAPHNLSATEIENFVRQKSHWIEEKMELAKQKKEERKLQKLLSKEDVHSLANQALLVIPSKVASFSKKIGVTYGRITIRNQKSRWGSCSGKGNLNFNCLLMLAPESVQDYVVVHELCHRKEMNHSDRFWKEVEQILPNYKEEKRWLKDHGNELIGQMQHLCNS